MRVRAGLDLPSRVADRTRRLWAVISFGNEHPVRRMLALAALGLLSGLGESAVVVLVVALVTDPGADALPFAEHLPGSTWALAASALAAVALLAVTHYASAAAAARAAAEVQTNVQTLLVGKYLSAPVTVRVRARAGELQELITGKSYVLADGAQEAAHALSAVLNLIVLVTVSLAISIWASLGLFVVAATVLLVARPFRSRRMRAMHRSAETQTAIAVETTETEAAATDVVIFGVVAQARERIASRIRATAETDRDLRLVSAVTPTLTRDVTVALLVVGLAVIVASGDVALAALGSTIVLMMRSLAHAQSLANVGVRVEHRIANLEVIEERLRAWTSSEFAGTAACPQMERIELRAATFTYPGASRPALESVDLVVNRGEQFGIVGRTGAGKSTLAWLLLGLITPDAGDVLVDGVPLTAIDRREWHARTAWLGQQPHLLSGTVRENIRYLRDLGDDAVAEAATAAGLAAELETWPRGLDHDVGPAGAALSGGQRQRVALARALAGNPDLLVLDEPTSALDAHAEASVTDALRAWRPRAMVAVIAHRVSTIRACDRIAVIERGRLVAVGPPAELEESNDYFRDVVALSAK